MSSEQTSVADLHSWLCETALPFWATGGLNPATGLAFEAMDQNGQGIVGLPIRIRVQFRQIYVFSHAATLGLFGAGASVALDLWRRTVTAGYRKNGQPGFAHILLADSSVLDPKRDSYDHAFAVLAATWLYKATGAPDVLTILDELLDFADTMLTDDYGALREGVPDSRPYRQNPQMHWFEAMLALMETGVRPDAAARALRFRRFMEQHHIDLESGCLLEFYGADWKPAPGTLGQRVEPGHMAEWSWLLHRHDCMTQQSSPALAQQLLQRALRFRDPVSGLLVDEGLCDFTILKPTRRSWLQTELCKALLAEYELGLSSDTTIFMRALHDLDRYHLRKPFPAGWIDQLDAKAQAISGPVPTSILYHVFVAIIEAMRVLQPSMPHRP